MSDQKIHVVRLTDAQMSMISFALGYAAGHALFNIYDCREISNKFEIATKEAANESIV